MFVAQVTVKYRKLPHLSKLKDNCVEQLLKKINEVNNMWVKSIQD